MGNWLASLLGMNGELPSVPPPTPRRLVTGNASIDAASELMPLPQRRMLDRLARLKKVSVAPMSATGSYADAPGLMLSADTLENAMKKGDDTEIAKTLTHEATHAMQPQGWYAQLMQRTMLDALDHDLPMTGVEYLDRPREREGRSEERHVRARR